MCKENEFLMTSCLYVYRGSPIGSAKIHIDSFIAALEKRGCQVHRYIPYDVEAMGRRPGKALTYILPRSPLILRNVVQYFTSKVFRRGLERVALDIGPDFIYERYSLFSDAGIKISDQVGCPHILEVNSIFNRFAPEFVSAPMMPLVAKHEMRIFRSTGHIFAVTERLRDELIANGVPVEQVSVTLNGVDEKTFRLVPGQPELARNELGFSNEDFVIVISMGFDHRFMVDSITRMMIASLKDIVEAKENLKLLIIGGGVQLERAKSRIESGIQVERITFTGRVPHDQVPKYLSAGDLAFIPWHNEFSSPLKLIEYLALELPVVAPALPGIMEIVDESFAWSFRPENAHEATAALLLATESLRRLREMGKRARARVQGRLTWDSNAREVLDVAENLLKFAN